MVNKKKQLKISTTNKVKFQWNYRSVEVFFFYILKFKYDGCHDSRRWSQVLRFLKKTLQCRKNSHQVLHGEQKKTVEKQYNK